MCPKRLWRRLATEEHGVALITAILVLLILQALAMVFVATAQRESRGTALHRNYEMAVQGAEAATDRVILEINDDETYSTGQPYLAGSPTPVQQRDWAVARFNEALALPARASEFVRTAQYDALGIRPQDPVTGDALDLIFGVARVAGGDPNAQPRFRVVRIGVAQGHYTAAHAVLTGGTLNLSGMTEDCSTSSGSGIRGSTGNVHSNTDVSHSGQPHVGGNASAVGNVGNWTNLCGASEPGAALVPLPVVDARRLYEQRETYGVNTFPATSYTGSWFDLCPNGDVRMPADAGNEPCTGGVLRLGSLAGIGPYRGWDFSGGRWNMTTSSPSFPGAYYVHHADARVGGSPGPVSFTVLASRSPSNVGGNLTVSGSPRFTPHMEGITFVADGNLDMSGTGSGMDMEGLFAAKGNVDISGNTTVRGSVVAHGTGIVRGNASITYDGGLAAPLPGHVRITDWNEL